MTWSQAARHRASVFILILGACGVLFVFLRPFVISELRWRQIHSRGSLRIGTDPGVKPFSFWDDKGWAGYDADVARELARRLNVQLEAVPVGYDGLFDALNIGVVDVSMSAISPDDGRGGEAAYSVPYIDLGVRLIGPAAADYRDLAALANSRVGTVLGGDADSQARYAERRVAGVQRIVLPNADAALESLRVGSIDWVLVDGRDVFGKIESCRPVQPASQSTESRLPQPHPAWQCLAIAPQPYVLAVRAENQQLLARVNAALAEMQSDGTLGRIATAWLSTK